MRRCVRPREWALIDAALAKAAGLGFSFAPLDAGFRASISVEVMNRHFTKYHLGRGFALHRFTGVDLGLPHDHPCVFSSLILKPYVEEIYRVGPDGWTCERVLRQVGVTHTVRTTTVHRLVELPAGESWTLVRYGRHVQKASFYRFGSIVEAKTMRQRRWRPDERWQAREKIAD